MHIINIIYFCTCTRRFRRIFTAAELCTASASSKHNNVCDTNSVCCDGLLKRD